jgi:hypothetical protein
MAIETAMPHTAAKTTCRLIRLSIVTLPLQPRTETRGLAF